MPVRATLRENRTEQNRQANCVNLQVNTAIRAYLWDNSLL